MVPVAVAGNISGEATTPSGNIFNEAMRGVIRGSGVRIPQPAPNRRANSDTYKRRTHSQNFLATSFSYQCIFGREVPVAQFLSAAVASQSLLSIMGCI